MNLARRLVILVLAVALAGATAIAQGNPKPIVIYNAQAVNLDSPVGTATGQVQIQITRWSADAERDNLMNALLEKGPSKMLDVLAKMPPVGSIRTPDTVGYNLRYARRTPLPDGAEQIVIITDRPMSFFERRQGPPTIDYPFTVVELRINANGEGEGKLSIATKILGDKASRSIALENYSVQPLMLQNVRRDPKS
jgi:hypothetical protein